MLDGSSAASEQHANTSHRPLRIVLIIAAVNLSFLLATPVRAGTPDRMLTFHIPSEPLYRALFDLGRETHLQILLRSTPRENVLTKALDGRYTVRQAIDRLLLGTHLTCKFKGHSLEIVSISGRADRDAKSEPATDSTRHAAPSRNTARRGAAASLQEVVVTGTHIRGGPPLSEPLTIITQRQIRASGYQTTEQLMDSLPENFASVGSVQSFDVGTESNAGNNINGAAVDLNGLGFDSTLVLVNGHRLAPAGVNGAFTDVSMIPLSAIKKVEIMTEGASAIYGADAVGGVVNYILKSHQSGLDTSLEYGTVTRGGLKDYRAVQSAGVDWASGHAFVTYEYHKRTALSSLDRPYAAFAGPYALLPQSYENSVYGTASEQLNDATTVDVDALFSNRWGSSEFAEGNLPVQAQEAARQYAAGIELDRRLPREWTLNFRVSDGGNRSSSTESYGDSIGHAGLVTAELGASGPVADLAAGQAKIAVGGQFRRETFRSTYTGLFVTDGAVNKSRTVDSVYIEGRIPIWAAPKNFPVPARVNIDLAARFEHYSDFGSALDPMAGIAWEALPTIRLRATASSSFRAPNFEELYGAQQLLLGNSVDPRAGNALEPVLFRLGSNTALQPEKSFEWTTGLDFLGGAIRLPISLTFFHIHFKDRIVSPNLPQLGVLGNTGLYGEFTQLNPSSSEIQSLLAEDPIFVNLTVYPGYGPPQSVGNTVAIADDRLQNIGATNVDGFDFQGSHSGRILTLHYNVGLQAAYLLKYENQLSTVSAPQELLSTFENPVNLRARLTGGLSKGGWSGHVAFNYVNHYENNTGPTPIEIASWTTMDIQLAYRFERTGTLLRGLRLAVSCTNCMNRAPPFVIPVGYVFDFDPANSSPLGRFVSLSLDKKW